jgi:hypothetical protein
VPDESPDAFHRQSTGSPTDRGDALIAAMLVRRCQWRIGFTPTVKRRQPCNVSGTT